MASRLTSKSVLLTIASGYVAAAVVHWPIGYTELAMTDTSFLLTWFVGAMVAGGVGMLFFNQSFPESGLLVMTGFILATLSRALVEIVADSTTHNLLPFELFIAAVVSFPGAVLGSLSIFLVRKFRVPGQK